MENRLQPEFVLFDLDGTLVDSRYDIAAAINHGLEKLGARPRSLEEIVPLIGRPLDDIFATLLPERMSVEAPRGASFYRPFYLEHCADRSVLFDGVENCLRTLEGMPMAVATTKRTDQARAVIRAFELDEYFGAVVGCDDIPHKPDPAVLLLAAEKLGFGPAGGLMVGDTIFDIEAGQRAGMATCAVTYGIGDAGELEAAGANWVIDSLSLLPRLLGGNR